MEKHLWDVIIHTFKKCSILNALYGTQDGALWEDSDKELSDDDLGHPGPSGGW